MTWSLMIWFSLTPGRWLALEIPQASQAECHQSVRSAAAFARRIGVHEFVVRCEVKP